MCELNSYVWATEQIWLLGDQVNCYTVHDSCHPSFSQLQLLDQLETGVGTGQVLEPIQSLFTFKPLKNSFAFPHTKPLQSHVMTSSGLV